MCRSVWENYKEYRDNRPLIRKEIKWSMEYAMLKVDARVQPLTARAQSLKNTILLSCYIAIAMKIIPEHLETLSKLHVKF